MAILRLVKEVKPGWERYSPRDALTPGFWTVADLPKRTLPRMGQRIVPTFSPPGKVMVYNLGKIGQNNVSGYLCVCGTRYFPVGPS